MHLSASEKMLIKVVTLTGKEIDIEDIEPTDTVYQIKEKVEGLEGIPISHQCFVTRGRLLNNWQQVGALSLREGSEIRLVLYNCVPLDHAGGYPH